MSPKLHCPFCYAAIKRRSELWFQCRGKPTPTRPACRPKIDEARRNHTGFALPTLPTFAPIAQPNQLLPPRKTARCPKCLGETSVRACPQCHTRLPVEFGVDASPLVAMVGARGTGKTVYLTVLAHELQRGELAGEFAATVQPIGDGEDNYALPARWLGDDIHQLYDAKRLLPVTEQAVDGRREPLVMEWRGRKAGLLGRDRPRTNYLSFYDTAGEDLHTDRDAFQLHYLSAATYLILLLDPFQLPRVRDLVPLPPAAVVQRYGRAEPTREVLGRITEVLKHSSHWNGRQVTMPVAVAFAKMDAFYDYLGDKHPLRRIRRRRHGYDDEAGRRVHEEMASLLHAWGGDVINDYLRSYYRDYRYFFVSALGAEPDYAEGSVHPTGVRPDRVEEPLLWLMHKAGLVPRVTT
ncbi:hypothetical protein Ade02nite_32560 [Paractinoplanes deccanensis]|uniref:Double-GTPase 2 domain-containing protein n=1 Tax=Paractinoplanes deccanensis TaxID=113561 RepID=A0ABQ3Y3T6_9ACTN|nr:hypothetical protein [Actinoplanes deccanensis]GID74615.1 hypothetical protein Ade02nite_32560 [Actinoplanes deccanensis]